MQIRGRRIYLLGSVQAVLTLFHGSAVLDVSWSCTSQQSLSGFAKDFQAPVAPRVSASCSGDSLNSSEFPQLPSSLHVLTGRYQVGNVSWKMRF